MYEALGEVALADGEWVECGVVTAPDDRWSQCIEQFLEHKNEIWHWHFDHALHRELPICHRFYLLHRDGVPLANILTATCAGVGSLGHVYTQPADRRKGAASLLIGKLLEHSRTVGVRMLLLGTAYGSSAYQIYAKHGFVGLGPNSGLMTWYAQDRRRFEAEWFADAPTRIERLSWQHWCTAAPLFSQLGPPWIRVSALRVFGPRGSEGCLLNVLRDLLAVDGQPGNSSHTDAYVSTRDDGAVLAFASWKKDEFWPGNVIVDVYSHPCHPQVSQPLLEALPLPRAGRLYEQAVAYSDADDAARIGALLGTGFSQVAQLPQFGRCVVEQASPKDVLLFRRKLV